MQRARFFTLVFFYGTTPSHASSKVFPKYRFLFFPFNFYFITSKWVVKVLKLVENLMFKDCQNRGAIWFSNFEVLVCILWIIVCTVMCTSFKSWHDFSWSEYYICLHSSIFIVALRERILRKPKKEILRLSVFS